MLEALVLNEYDAAVLAELARGRLRNKIPICAAPFTGRITEHHRFLLQILLVLLNFFICVIERVSARVELGSAFLRLNWR